MQIASIALCRVSTLEQRTTGHSLDRQAVNVVKAAEFLGAPIIKTWSLDQSSRVGKNINRKDIKEMMSFCKSNKQVRFLIVDEVDRFMRDMEFCQYFEVCFKLIGVKVWYASQPVLNGDDLMAKFYKLMEMFKAEASNVERTTKSLNGLKGRIAAGYWPFPLHQGYTKCDVPGLHVPDPVRFKLLQQAGLEVVSGQYTVYQAHKRLLEKGYTTPSGKLLKIDKFIELLKDSYYCGVLRIEQWDEALVNEKGLHQPMFSREQFDEIQFILSGRKQKYVRKTHNPDFPLSNLVHCVCGGRFVGFVHRNGHGSSWRCPKYRCRKCRKQYRLTDIHSNLDLLLADIKLDQSRREKLIIYLKNVWQENQKTNLQHQQAVERHLEKLKDKKSGLINAMALNPDLAEDIKEQIEKVKKEIDFAERQQAETPSLEEDQIEFVKFALAYINNLKLKWWEIDHDSRVKCKLLLFPQEIFVNSEKKVYTPQISIILSLKGTKKEAFRASNSHVVGERGVEPPRGCPHYDLNVACLPFHHSPIIIILRLTFIGYVERYHLTIRASLPLPINVSLLLDSFLFHIPVTNMIKA